MPEKQHRYGVINTRFLKEFNKPHKIKIFYGGAGSGKSVSIAQHFILGLCSGDGARRLVLRKYFPSLKISTYLVLKEILDDWGVEYFEHKTDHYFRVGENYLFYMSLDDPEKVKGGEFKEIWLEESTEFTKDDFDQLLIRLQRDKRSDSTYIYLSFNPIDINHWLIPYMDQADRKKVNIHHSTYKDNLANLNPDFVAQLKSFEATDTNFYNIYTLGRPGVLQNRIYSHFQIEDSSNWSWKDLARSQRVYGLDFGFNHKMALCEVWFCNNELYVRELYYKEGTTTDDLAIFMQRSGVSHSDYIFADAAEPDRIAVLNTSRHIKTKLSDTGEEVSIYVPRYNVFAAKKDVVAGIDFIKSHKVHLCSESAGAIKEYQNYKYKKRSDGTVIDEPVKAFDDFLDSFRYAAYSLKVQTNMHVSNDIGYSFAKNKGIDPFRAM